jgi:hypothetical protein
VLPIEFNDPSGLLLLQRGLGQVLFYPPNVAGWPGGKTWIDSSSLMLRMRVPRLLLGEDEWNFQTKSDDDVQMGMMQNMQRRFEGTINWSLLLKTCEGIPVDQLTDRLMDSLLLIRDPRSVGPIRSYSKTVDRDTAIRSLTAHILSIPEYQLC